MTHRIGSKLIFAGRSLFVALVILVAAAVAAPAAHAQSSTTNPKKVSLYCKASYELDFDNPLDDKGNFHFVYKVHIKNTGDKLSAEIPVRVYTSVRSLRGLPTTKPFWSITKKIVKLEAGQTQDLTFKKAIVGFTAKEAKVYATDPSALTHVKRISMTTQYIVDGKGTNCANYRVMDYIHTRKTGNSPQDVYFENRNYIDL